MWNVDYFNFCSAFIFWINSFPSLQNRKHVCPTSDICEISKQYKKDHFLPVPLDSGYSRHGTLQFQENNSCSYCEGKELYFKTGQNSRHELWCQLHFCIVSIVT